MRSKELRAKFLQTQMENLERDYESVVKNLQVELDGTTKNKLKDRLAMLEQEMDDCERELSSLRQEGLSDIDSLTSILLSHNSCLSDIQAAYAYVLRQWEWPIQIIEQVPDALVTQLLGMPQGEFLYEAIAFFAAKLVAVTQETALITDLQDWGTQRLGDRWEVLRRQIEQAQTEPDRPEHSAMLIQLIRSDEASTQSEDETFYQVKAWLVGDVARYRECQQGKSLPSELTAQQQGLLVQLALSEDTGVATYALSALADELPALIARFLEECADSLEVDPALHIFLPLELMNYAVDRWQLCDDYGDPEALGDYYKVMLRCSERLARNYRQRNRWKEKWQHHDLARSQPAHSAFIAGDDSDLVSLKKKLRAAQDSVIGLKILQAPNREAPHKVFAAVLQAGMPCAIWGRENLTGMTNGDELDRVLQLCCLENLPSTVQTERSQAAGEPEDTHVGHHLSLLWDDPHLLPPRSA